VLHRVAALIRERAEPLAQQQRLNNGKPISETRALVASAVGTFQFFAAACETLEETLTPARGDFFSMSVFEPMGVVAAITPWNSPIASEAQKLAPALAAGNAVVIKPAEVTPLMALELAALCEEAGVPRGMVTVLPGRGFVIGDAITRHPMVRRVSFTGGTGTGKHIARIAADKMMPVSLELGGKSATMVLEDADLDHAVNGVLYGIFSSSGESCIAGSRLFVARKLHAAFLDKLAARAAALRVGDPADERTQMGPLITAKLRETVEGYVALGRSEGGRVVTGGCRPEGAPYERGHYYLPTIIDGLKNADRACQEEIFGPVLVTLPFDDEGDLLAQANDSVYALAAGIWTRDYKRAWRIGRAVQAGTVWINTYKQFSISTPFGGWRDSGLGREKGRLGIQQYMTEEPVLGPQRAAASLGELSKDREIMSVLGIDEITHGVEDLESCRRFFIDWGLRLQEEVPAARLVFETLNGCRVIAVVANDPSLPPAMEAGSTLREVVWGVESEDDLARLAQHLSSQPGFVQHDGRVGCTDPNGLAVRLQVTRKRPVEVESAEFNTWSRKSRINQASPAYERATPIEVGHVVFFVQDVATCERFYIEHLGFAQSDRYPGRGSFCVARLKAATMTSSCSSARTATVA